MIPQLRRTLSPVERWCWIADQVSPFNVVARVRLQGQLSPELLIAAAGSLAAEYPVLRVGIAADPDGTHPTYVPSSQPIAVRTVTGDDTEWQRQIDGHELSTALDWRAGPLVRVVDVAAGAGDMHDLILTVSHIIADATTALLLLRRLIEHAERLRLNADDRVNSRPVLGAPEELLPAGFRGIRGAARMAVTEIADGVATKITRVRRLQPDATVPATSRRTRLLCRALSADQLDALTRRCRAESVTVHGALAAAMAMAIGPIAAQSDSGRLCIGSPVDLRAELDPPMPADEAGAFASTVLSIVRFAGDRDLWSIARQVNRSLGRRTRFGQHLATLSAVRYVCPASLATSARTIGLIERHGASNVCLSNLGRYDFPTRIGKWSLSGAQFIVGISVTGYFIAAVNSSHGQLFWNFTFIDSVVSQPTAQQFADNAVATLLDAVG